MAEYIRFRTVDRGELIRKSQDNVFGVTGCGYDSRWATSYRVGDYLLCGSEGPPESPSKMTLERIISMEILPGSPASADEGNGAALESEPAHA